MNLPSFEELAYKRRSVRQFAPDLISEEILTKLLEITQRSPSGYNLQPVHYVVIQQPDTKKAIEKASFYQQAIVTAPVVIAFAADRDVAKNNLSQVLNLDIEAGAISPEEAEMMAGFVDMSFSHAPLGLGWIAKALAPIYRLFSPTPELPAVHKKAWLHLHVGLNVMNFILAAQSAGLSTCPIASFDPWRVRRALDLPRRFVIPLLVAVGYAKEEPKQRARLPLEEVVHWR